MAAEPYRQSIDIAASPDLVFDYFTDPAAIARWMGDRAVLDPRPGGQFVLFFGERSVEGCYEEVDRPRRLVISWGRRGSEQMPPLSSTLEVTFTPNGDGTRVSIVHHGLPDIELPRHALGWRHYLGRLRLVGEGRDPGSDTLLASLSEGAD